MPTTLLPSHRPPRHPEAHGPDQPVATVGAQRRKPIRNGGGRPKIDWGAARSYYARNPEVGYGDVGRKFGVSDSAVCKHANAEGWDDYRADILAAVAARRRTTDIRSLEERQADTIRVADRLREVALADDADIDAKTAIQSLPAFAKLEELFAGNATDRVSVAEVRDFMSRFVASIDNALVESLDESLANGKRAVVLRAFRERMPVVLERAAIEGPST